jgi:hypothetical protein
MIWKIKGGIKIITGNFLMFVVFGFVYPSIVV